MTTKRKSDGLYKKQIRSRGETFSVSELRPRNTPVEFGECSSGGVASKRQKMIRDKLSHQISKEYVNDQPTPSGKNPIAYKKDRASISQTPTPSSRTRNRRTSERVVTSPYSGPTSLYRDLGDCLCVCQYCCATFWYEERSKSHYRDGMIHYKKCCNNGKVRLPAASDPPEYIKALFEDAHFMDNIRAYNSMFSMTSFGASIDETVNTRSGPYVFKLCGQIYHWIGSLCPPPGDTPKFLQLYICDTSNEVRNRISHFGGEDSTPLKQEIVEGLIKILDRHNHLVRLFRNARDKCAGQDIPEFNIRLYDKPRHNQYELPTTEGLGAIVFETEPNTQNDCDVIIHSKDGFPQRINKLHPAYMSTQFPLLFIYGESGYRKDLRLAETPGSTTTGTKRLTIMMFYSFQLHDRLNMYSLILRGGRLFQQYLVNAWVTIEQCRLDYIQDTQSDIRGEYLQGIHDAILRGDHDGSDVGSRTILPSSFVGGPRYMYKHYQDALAICRVHGNPQFFITFTCNVKWPEIQRYISKFPRLHPQDKPEVVDRIFKMKVKEFLKFLKEHKLLGDVVADLYTIEFQKRGLPHCHLLLWVTPASRITCPEEIDKYISAEIPDEVVDPEGYKVVSEFMMHGPCGLVRSDAVCMDKDVCTKHFPKQYVQNTYIDDNGFVHYRRRDTDSYVIKHDQELDNSYVVPYNRLLSLIFYAHINVEFCGRTMLIKYLFKYISKGCDKTRAHITRTTVESGPSTKAPRQIDEIKNYVEARYICPHEAAWRILGFEIHKRSPAIQVLSVHLKNMQHISLRSADRLEAVANNTFVKKTTLTEWFDYNSNHVQGRHLTYLEFPLEFVWYAGQKYWSPRANKKKYSIGRLGNVPPTEGELFYLRMLLSHRKGCTGYEDLQTVDNVMYPTFRSACDALGLLGDDTEWTIAFNEAAAWATTLELRTLFAHMLIYCQIVDPVRLWKSHWKQMADDIPMRISNNTGIRNFHVNEQEMEGYVLYEIEIVLNSCSKTLQDYVLPMPPSHLLNDLNNRLLMEERNYNRSSLSIEQQILVSQLNTRQKRVYDMIIRPSTYDAQALIFVYGHGGTGKTFLWKAIITTLRAQGKIVLAVASSGIASLLLPSGRTAHSRFKLPLELTEESMCNIKKGTQLADLLQQTDLILWDEAPMNNKKCFEVLDRSMRDILDKPQILFGGKSVILGGDFRQTLPIQPAGNKADIISSSIPESYLWAHFKLCTLTENMRLLHPNLNQTQKSKIAAFSRWLLDIGDGVVGVRDKLDPENSSWIKIPQQYLIQDDDVGLSKLINFIYDEDTLQNPTAESLQDKAIVCPKNDTADEINTKILASLLGNAVTYHSFDMVTPVSGDVEESEILYPSEYLNTLAFKGLPQHQLILKVGAPIMLIRNMNILSGLCNGTRMIVTQCLSKVIEAKVITGTKIGHKVFIPRIQLIHKDPTLPFIFKRKQFPVKVCYAMTINKSQGQSLNKIGVYLPNPIFGHGQLYVALSRATSPDGLRLLMKQQDDQPDNFTKNIVYTDYLRKIAHSQENFGESYERTTPHQIP